VRAHEGRRDLGVAGVDRVEDLEVLGDRGVDAFLGREALDAQDVDPCGDLAEEALRGAVAARLGDVGVEALVGADDRGRRGVRAGRVALVYTELRDNGDYYYSITLPSLIVATYGGGTGLPTQRESLELLGCYGSDKVLKFAEIVAATVLCGEISLASAIVAQEWVTAHDQYGRNRP
jgi:hypothetical protein